MFDLELQVPAASTQLPGGRPSFHSILGCFGHASAGSAPLATGLDFMYCLHQVPPSAAMATSTPSQPGLSLTDRVRDPNQAPLYTVSEQIVRRRAFLNVSSCT